MYFCAFFIFPLIPNETSYSNGFFLGSEIYQETLAKALAKHFGARLLIVDSLLLPGVSFFDVCIIYIFKVKKFIYIVF